MGAIADLWKSERGLIAVLLIIGATVLTALGDMTVAEWREFTVWIFGLYAGAKTITGVAALITGNATDSNANADTATTPTPTPVPTPTPTSTPDDKKE